MAQRPATDAPIDFAARMRDAGVKVTRHRLRVLHALEAAPQPLCHAELETRLAGREAADAAIDRVTLYRVLDSLVACGLAQKAVDTRGVFRFALAGARQHDSHLHFRCTDCGSVYCLKAEPPPPPRLPRGFRLRQVAFDVSGTCADCATERA